MPPSTLKAPLCGVVLAALLAGAGPARAQTWPNDVGIRQDVIGQAVAPLDRLRPPPGLAAAPLDGPGRLPVPILDWSAPPVAAPPPAVPARRRNPVRRAAAPRAEAPAVARAAPVPTIDLAMVERRLQERERSISDLQRLAEEDRRGLQRLRDQQASPTVPVVPAAAPPVSPSPAPSAPAETPPR